MTKHKSKVNTRKLIYNMTTTAVLAALGSILMIIGHYFSYPIAPFLKLEPSDTVVLVAYALCGFPSALCTAFIKTLLDFAINGMSGPYGIGQIIALCTSLAYVLGLFLCSKVFRLFNKGFWFRVISYVIVILIVTTIITMMNFFIFTPVFLTGQFVTFMDPAFQGIFENPAIPFKGPFIVVIILLYLPFNLLKGLIVCALYELLFNRIIFYYFKPSKFYKNIVGNKNIETETKQNEEYNKEEEKKDN